MSTLLVRRSWRLAALFLAATSLGACAVPGTDGSRIRAVAPGEERILFAADEFLGTTPRRALFMDDWEREEYARFEGRGARAELIYITSVSPNVALEYPFMVRDTVGTWNMSRRNAPQWGPSGQASAAFDTIYTQSFYTQSFTFGGTDRPCVGFNAEWDMVGDDPANRVGKVLFGYYCAPSGTVLTEERIASLLGTVGIRGVTERLGKRARGPAPAVSPAQAAQAAQTARGASPTADTGNAGFPFGFGQYFTVGNGGERDTN